MITRKIFAALVAAFALCSHSLWSQSTEVTCPSDELNDALLENNPQFARSYMYFKQAVHEQMLLSEAERDDEVYTIPVVVHVIHEGEAVGTGSNISDAQIFSAIEALNNDFRKIPGTAGDGDGADVGIDFCLAARDDDGNSTNGIVRVNGTSVPDYSEFGIEATGGVGADELAVKSLSTWSRFDYLNIWVVNEIEDNNGGGGIQGYAYFPINNPVDGVVVLYNAIGTVGNLKPSTDMSRTVTHEVGHYLNLYHTFHNTNTCNAESNCENLGDQVCDTPPTILSSDCDMPACSGTQQVENYMDYTEEDCHDMFSDGQKIRMRTALLEDRFTLISSLGCVPVSELDCAITATVSPNGNVCQTTFAAEVTLTNFGNATLTSCNINYNIDGVGMNTYGWTGSLATGNSINVELPFISSSSGSHSFIAWTSIPNGLSDQYTANDQWASSYTIASGSNATLLVELDFFGSENTWKIFDASNAIIADGGPYVNNQQGLDIEENICLSNGCYTLTFYDTYGDGQNFTTGDFTLFDGEGNQLAYGAEDWGEEVSNDFCIEATIPEGETPVANFSAQDNLICTATNIDFTDMSANVPTSWNWTFEGGSPATSNAQHPQNISYALAGNYNVTLVASNAFGTNTYTCTDCITVSAGPSVTTTVTNLFCYNQNTGSITTNVTGNSPFTYLWNNGATASNISALSAGNYNVTVTDEDGCTKLKNAVVTQPTEITVSANIIAVSCYGMSDGSITSAASGGTGTLDYSWSSGNNGASISNKPAGSYTLSIADDNNCLKQQTYSITQPSVLLANLSDFDIACTDEFGSASVSPAGGTAPFTVEWSTGASGNNSGNLATGSYSVSISDAHNCATNNAFEITQSENLALALNITPISCHGDTDGGASVIVNGGTGDYDYEWSTGNSWTSISNRGPGTYSIAVTDSDGCSGYQEFTLSDPPAVSLAVFKTDISCYGLSNGTATATATGGTGEFEYAWSTGETSQFITELEEGTYMVTSTDEHGCADNESILIIEPSQLSATATMTAAETCAGNDGALVVNVMGGTSGYSYQWSNGVFSSTNSGISSGSYSAIVTDGNGCQTEVTAEVIYDCDIILPTTALQAGHCNVSDFVLGDVILCIEVNEAEMYQWKFINSTGDILTEEFTIDNGFQLSQVDGLEWGMTAYVQVKALTQDMWGPYGDICSIGIIEQLPTTSLVAEDCGATAVSIGHVLTAQSIAGASQYEWHFTGPEYDFTSYTNINQLEITAGMLFQAFTTYNVMVRCVVNDVWNEFGEICQLTFGELVYVTENTALNSLPDIYPNPSTGQKIFFDFSNLSGNDEVQNIEIFGTTGNLIENIKLSETPYQGLRTEYSFKHPLSAGIYVLRYQLNGKSNEEKLVVR